jgi:hypothetical protein
MQISTIGIDLAKNVFHMASTLPRSRCSGSAQAEPGARVFQGAPLPEKNIERLSQAFDVELRLAAFATPTS